MGKLIVVVGSTGVGKTTLARLLCREMGFTSGLEDHADRPFQVMFKNDHRYALPNQLDFLLFRMEQEASIRSGPSHGILDGGLEMDFHGFTRLFHSRGWLKDDEFDICSQLYRLARTLLPPPDVIIHLTASPDAIARRLAGRDRINIASAEDSALLDSFLGEWLSGVDPRYLITLDVSRDEITYANNLPGLVRSVQQKLGFA